MRRLGWVALAARARVHQLPGGRIIWRVLIGLIGTGAVIVGVILLPLPGPGWLIIFVGLGILATEFQWAKWLLSQARRFFDAWTAWLVRQPRWAQLAIGALGLVFLAALGYAGWLVYQSR